MSTNIVTNTTNLFDKLNTEDSIAVVIGIARLCRALPPKLAEDWRLAELNTQTHLSVEEAVEALRCLPAAKWDGLLVRSVGPSLTMKQVVRAVGQGIVQQVIYGSRALAQVAETIVGSPQEKQAAVERYRSNQFELWSVALQLFPHALQLNVVQLGQQVTALEAVARVREHFSTVELEVVNGLLEKIMIKQGRGQHLLKQGRGAPFAGHDGRRPTLVQGR